VCTTLSIPALFAFYEYTKSHGDSGELGMISLVFTLGMFVNGVYALITTGKKGVALVL
jgi:hypothetical protein